MSDYLTTHEALRNACYFIFNPKSPRTLADKLKNLEDVFQKKAKTNINTALDWLHLVVKQSLSPTPLKNFPDFSEHLSETDRASIRKKAHSIYVTLLAQAEDSYEISMILGTWSFILIGDRDPLVTQELHAALDQHIAEEGRGAAFVSLLKDHFPMKGNLELTEIIPEKIAAAGKIALDRMDDVKGCAWTNDEFLKNIYFGFISLLRTEYLPPENKKTILANTMAFMKACVEKNPATGLSLIAMGSFLDLDPDTREDLIRQRLDLANDHLSKAPEQALICVRRLLSPHHSRSKAAELAPVYYEDMLDRYAEQDPASFLDFQARNIELLISEALPWTPPAKELDPLITHFVVCLERSFAAQPGDTFERFIDILLKKGPSNEPPSVPLWWEPLFDFAAATMLKNHPTELGQILSRWDPTRSFPSRATNKLSSLRTQLAAADAAPLPPTKPPKNTRIELLEPTK